MKKGLALLCLTSYAISVSAVAQSLEQLDRNGEAFHAAEATREEIAAKYEVFDFAKKPQPNPYQTSGNIGGTAGSDAPSAGALVKNEKLERLRNAKIKSKVFEGAYRMSKAVLSGTQGGVTFRDYGPLLQPFLAEVSIVKDLAITEDEKLLAAAYSDAATVYSAAGRTWSAMMRFGGGQIMGGYWIVAREIVEPCNEAYLRAYRAEQEPPTPTPSPKPAKAKTRPKK